MKTEDKIKQALKREADLQTRAYACGSPYTTLSAVKAQEAYNMNKFGKKAVR